MYNCPHFIQFKVWSTHPAPVICDYDSSLFSMCGRHILPLVMRLRPQLLPILCVQLYHFCYCIFIQSLIPCIHIKIYVQTFIHKSLYIYVYIYMYICIYIYIYRQIFIFICKSAGIPAAITKDDTKTSTKVYFTTDCFTLIRFSSE